VRPTLAALAHQARSLQRLLHPAVAHLQLVIFPQLLVKMQHAEIEVLLLVQRQYLLDDFQRNPVDAPLSASLIEQTVIAKLFVALFDPSHSSIRDAGDLCRCHPADSFRYRFQNHVL
jgi:hypothetical protein